MFGFKKSSKREAEQKTPVTDTAVKSESESTVQKEKINFYVPDFYSNSALYILLADFIEHIPKWFYDDFKIAAAYGSFPNCIWNGGRVFLDRIDKASMELVVNELNKRGIAVRYTFTNPVIEEKHMSDTFGNLCLDVANNGMNEVLVNAPCIEEHVRANYPNYKIISSVTKCLRTVEQVEEELEKDYYLVVLDTALNKDERIFNIAKRDRLELLVDHSCRLNCPRREQHYIEVGTSQLNFSQTSFVCPHTVKTFEELMKTEHIIDRDLMNERYIPCGFKHFKLDGRAFMAETLVDTLMHYMVRPEYREKVKGIIRKEIYNNEDW